MKINNIAELKTRKGASNANVEVLGYYTSGDSGGGSFYWDNTSTETDNGGTIIQVTGVITGRWKRRVDDIVSVRWFGAKGDGVTNDSVSFQNAINFAKNGKTVIIPSGTFSVGDIAIPSFTRIISNTSNVSNWITDSNTEIIPVTGCSYIFDFEANSVNSEIENIYINGKSFFNPNLIAAIRLRGRFHNLHKNNLVDIARHAVIATNSYNLRIIGNNFHGLKNRSIDYSLGYIGSFHIDLVGDSYFINNEIGGGSDYVSYVDPVYYNAVAFYAGQLDNSVVSGNLFEVTDKGCVINIGINNSFSDNRYEFNNSGGLILKTVTQSVFTSEHFSNNSVVVEGVFDNLKIEPNCGSLTFIAPIFNSLVNAAFDTHKVRYNISNQRPIIPTTFAIRIIAPFFSENSSVNGNYNLNSGYYKALAQGEDIIFNNGDNVGIDIYPLHKLDVNGNVNIGINNFYKIEGQNIISRNSSFWNYIYDWSGGQAIMLGGTSDPSNYYNNTNHIYRNRSGVLFASISEKGITPPKMTTTQRNALVSPTSGLMVYDTTLNKLCVYTTTWEVIASA